jgi:hypothetical protein
MKIFLLFALSPITLANPTIVDDLLALGIEPSLARKVTQGNLFRLSKSHTTVLQIISQRINELKQEKASNEQLLSIIRETETSINVKLNVIKTHESFLYLTDKLVTARKSNDEILSKMRATEKIVSDKILAIEKKEINISDKLKLILKKEVELKTVEVNISYILNERQAEIDQKEKEFASSAKEIQQKQDDWAFLEAKLSQNQKAFPNIVDLNIGGKKISASKVTLTNIPDTFFDALVRSPWKQPPAGEAYYIDRSSTYINRIMDYMRSGVLNLHNLGAQDYISLREELDFYSMSDAIIKLKAYTTRWISETATVSPDGLSVIHFKNYRYTAAIGNHPVDEFTMRFRDCVRMLVICFSDVITFNTYQPNYYNGDNSYCISRIDGRLFSSNIPSGKKEGEPFTGPFIDGDLITMKRVNTDINILKNGIDLGIAYSNVSDVDLFPAVDMMGECYVAFVID